MSEFGLLFAIMLILSGLIIVLVAGVHVRFVQLENKIKALIEINNLTKTNKKVN